VTEEAKLPQCSACEHWRKRPGALSQYAPCYEGWGIVAGKHATDSCAKHKEKIDAKN
jgi:hypothetical protein